MTDTHVPADRRPESYEDVDPGERAATSLNPWTVALLVVSALLVLIGALAAVRGDSAGFFAGTIFLITGIVGVLLAMAVKAVRWAHPTR
jgi:hypothetical protein